MFYSNTLLELFKFEMHKILIFQVGSKAECAVKCCRMKCVGFSFKTTETTDALTCYLVTHAPSEYIQVDNTHYYSLMPR